MEKDSSTIKNSIGTIIGNNNQQDIKIGQKIQEEKSFSLPIIVFDRNSF